ncbi:COP9 signalosome complex subunit 8 [Linum perenne]
MDFALLSNALGCESYGKIADICDELMLKANAAAEGVPFQDEWPYAIHLLGYIYLNDVNSARFLWKTIPSVIKDSQPEVELYSKRMFQLLLSAYSTISVKDTALFLGMTEEDAKNYVVQQGWSLDSDTEMLTVKKQASGMEQKRDPGKLQRLTEYVFHLEH